MKQELISKLKSEGFDFSRSVFELSFSERTMLAVYAKQFGYRKPKNGYCSLGGSFYMHLQKLAKKL